MENRLKTLRKERRLTQDEAAEAMGVSKGQYIKLERGERRLTADYISRAARAFRVPQAEVIEEASMDSLDRMLDDFPPELADEADLIREDLKRQITRQKEMLERARHAR